MKLDPRGIRFRFWSVFLLFAIGITFFIGALQMGLIRPYYRNSKTQSVKIVADEIQNDLIGAKGGSAEGVSSALQTAIDNNVCIVIVNDSNELVYSADSLGAGCVFHTANAVDQMDFQQPSLLRDSILENNGEFTMNVHNQRTNQEMIVYGRAVKEMLGNYYLLVNSPLEPIDSVVTFYIRQYAIYTLMALIIASLVSALISKSVTQPIVNMEKEAEKLASADYSAHFDGGTYTETKELASSLNQANKRLSNIDALRRDLIANVSHDIRTPLTDIRAYAEMIKDISGEDKVKREKHLDVIIKETDYMNHLVQDMSELAQMQTENYHPNLENVDLSKIIDEMVEIEEPQITKNHLYLNIEVEDDLIIYADEIKIGQVITNFLSNAIKFSPENGTISIRAFQKEDGKIRVEIEDEGEGIPEEEIETIWSRYQRTSSSFSRNISGTGLGLAIAKAILDSHHAQYGVESTLGEGSLFWFEFEENDFE